MRYSWTHLSQHHSLHKASSKTRKADSNDFGEKKHSKHLVSRSLLSFSNDRQSKPSSSGSPSPLKESSGLSIIWGNRFRRNKKDASNPSATNQAFLQKAVHSKDSVSNSPYGYLLPEAQPSNTSIIAIKSGVPSLENLPSTNSKRLLPSPSISKGRAHAKELFSQSFSHLKQARQKLSDYWKPNVKQITQPVETRFPKQPTQEASYSNETKPQLFDKRTLMPIAEADESLAQSIEKQENQLSSPVQSFQDVSQTDSRIAAAKQSRLADESAPWVTLKTPISEKAPAQGGCKSTPDNIPPKPRLTQYKTNTKRQLGPYNAAAQLQLRHSIFAPAPPPSDELELFKTALLEEQRILEREAAMHKSPPASKTQNNPIASPSSLQTGNNHSQESGVDIPDDDSQASPPISTSSSKENLKFLTPDTRATTVDSKTSDHVGSNANFSMSQLNVNLLAEPEFKELSDAEIKARLGNKKIARTRTFLRPETETLIPPQAQANNTPDGNKDLNQVTAFTLSPTRAVTTALTENKKLNHPRLRSLNVSALHDLDQARKVLTKEQFEKVLEVITTPNPKPFAVISKPLSDMSLEELAQLPSRTGEVGSSRYETLIQNAILEKIGFKKS